MMHDWTFPTVGEYFLKYFANISSEYNVTILISSNIHWQHFTGGFNDISTKRSSSWKSNMHLSFDINIFFYNDRSIFDWEIRR